MIKLTLEFSTLEEVGAFIAAKGANTEVKPVNVEVKPEAPKAKKYTDDELLAMSDDEAKSLKPAQKTKRTKLLKKQLEASKPAPVQETAAKVMEVEMPPVIEEPKAPEIDRDYYIEQASLLVNKIKDLGVEDSEIMPKLMQAYTAAGVTKFCRISELSDSDLPNVVNKIEELVNSMSQPSTGSYI